MRARPTEKPPGHSKAAEFAWQKDDVFGRGGSLQKLDAENMPSIESGSIDACSVSLDLFSFLYATASCRHALDILMHC